MSKGAQPLQFAAWGADEYWSALRSVVTGRVANGPDIGILQHQLGEVYKPSTTLTVNAGRTALRLALEVFSARRPDRRRVLMPAYLCPSAVDVVRDLGLEPWPVEVGSDLNLNPDCLFFNGGVLAVVAAHMYGCPARIGEIERRCRQADVFLIDDAAQVVGVRSHGRMLGTFGDAGVLSFAQSKTIVTGVRGSGGVLLINNMDFKPDLLRAHAKLSVPRNRLTSFILFLTEYLLASKLGSAGYYANRIAYAILPAARINPYVPALLSNLEAAIAIAQLKRLPQIIVAKTRVADLYAMTLSSIPSLKMPQSEPGRFLTRCFVEFSEPETALRVRRRLLEKKISTRTAYPAWSECTDTADSDSIADRLVEMPSRLEMMEEDVVTIADYIRETLYSNRREPISEQP